MSKAARPAGRLARLVGRARRALAGLNLSERLAVAVIAFFVLVGCAFLGHGLYIKAKAELAQILLERAWTRTLAGAPHARPWPWADMWPVARLDMPRLGRSAIVLNAASGEAMAFGPGHLQRSPLPGQAGISVIVAHRDTHFAFLKHVRPKDILRITLADGRPRRYRVSGFEVVEADASGIEAHVPGPSKLALVTCWPFGALSGGSLRYVVHAEAEPGPVRSAEIRWRTPGEGLSP